MQSTSRSLVIAIALGWSGAMAPVALAAPLSTNLIMYHDYDGDLLDNSGRGNNGTGMSYDFSGGAFPVGGYQNGNTATIAYGTGKIGQAAWINSDGTTAGNGNYITLGSHTSNPDFNFGNTVDTQNPNPPIPMDFSISMWVKGFFNPLANADVRFISNKGSGGNDTGWYLRRGTGGRLNANLAYDDGDPNPPNPRADGGGIGADLNDNLWHHMGVSLDRDGSGRAFIDGNTSPAFTFGITDLAVLTLNPNDSNLRINIGQDGTGGYANRWTDGLLVDDIAIWQRKLNSGDFASIYNAGIANNSLATVLGGELAPDDPPPPNQIFNWNFGSYATGNFDSVGAPGNETWLDGALAPLAFAPNDPDGNGGSLHTVNIDNATVTVTDNRLVSALNLATVGGTTTTLVVASGAQLDGTSTGGFNVGVAGNGTMIVNGTGNVRTRGGFNINVGGAGGVGLVEQNDSSVVEVGIWLPSDNEMGAFNSSGTVRLVIGAAANSTGEYRISDNAIVRGGRDIRIGVGAGTNATLIMEGNSKTYASEGLRFGDATVAASVEPLPAGITAIATIRDNAQVSAQIISMLDGRQHNSVHTFNIQDNAVVNAGVFFTVGETISGNTTEVPGHGIAILNQTGGTVNIGNLKTSVAVSSYQDAGYLDIALGNAGNNGVKSHGGSIDGRYNLSGGTLNSTRFANVGVNFDGTFNHTGGTANFKSGDFNAGTNTWSGGKAVSASFADAGGHLTLGGTDGTGATQVPSTAIPAANALGNGVYNVSGTAAMNVEGTMTVSRHGDGTFKVTGGQANIQVGTGYTVDTAWTSGGASPRVVPQGVFRVQDGSFTLGNSTGNGKLISEITATGVSAVNVHGNVTIGPNSTYEVIATSLPAAGAYAWNVLVADSDGDGLYSGGPAAALTGSFATKTIPAIVDALDRKLRYLVEGEDKRIVLGLSHDGDVNFDGVVNIFDINLVSSGWDTTNDRPDANGDNIVNIFDINLISSNWNNTVNGSITAVPEPSTLVLAAAGVVGLLFAGRRSSIRVRRLE